ncbi:hypothetical protein SYNPS1DRAFT_23782 [Syncephalis pseudoplumigaleata]|uniref:Uncharacterized protein n=1 Tax=Syncephalis pseudoplumigaleata TaxID=1712513 RepID=A0A4P9YVM7_9FUNG|nr:hypothetical protein SYNPS1DRAFT_23782 [Syncephalis pseudoplumigaleata]|eukprot:RKP24123.1 hypothetical protein SYNPS1DRAFT_23782 [Syncephalis pseudoplumigaleata]
MNQLLDIFYISRNGMELRENGDISDEAVIGTSFVDVLLQLYNSQVDLTLLEDGMLRHWIESIILIVRKCNIKDANRMEELANIVMQLALLLNGPIAADNQILIVSTFTLVLEQSPNIIASALWRVIQCVGALLTRLRNHTHNLLFTKARHFLARAIAKFSDSGIFLLIFKNSPSPGHMVDTDQLVPSMDMLFVLKTIITDIERYPPDDYEATMPLREKPVHDVLHRIFTLKTLDKSGVSRVLYNMSRYINVTHPLPFCDQLAHDYIGFLTRLARHTANWDPSEFNVIPVLSSTAIILQEHLYHYEAMVNAAMTLFRHALQRFEVSRTVIINMIMAFDQLSKRLPDHLAQTQENAFARCVVAEVEARLGGRSPMLASTATNCIEPLLLSENESNLRLAVTQLLVFNMEHHGMEVTEFLQDNNNVKGALQALCWLCVATLASESIAMYRTLLGAQRVVSLLTLAFSAGHGPEFDSISKLAFIAVKTLSLLYRRIAVVPHLRDSNLEAFAEGEETMWREVWPVLKDQLIVLFNPMFEHGALDTHVEVIWQDFIDMIVFLQRANAHGLRLHAEQWPMLLDKYMDRLIRVSVLAGQSMSKSGSGGNSGNGGGGGGLSSTTTFAAGASSSSALAGVTSMPAIIRARSFSSPTHAGDRVATGTFAHLTVPRSGQSRSGIKKPT